MKNNTKIWLPLIIALAILAGYTLRHFVTDRKINYTVLQQPASGGKVDNILHLLNNNYYQNIDTDSIREAIIPTMLENLDPHTVYINAEHMKQVKEDMQGHFSGIGVQFIMYEDTVMVVRPIDNGPSQQSGILAGDRIVTVDGDTIASKELSTDSIMRRLKGAEGSSVALGVRRNAADTLQYFDVKRGAVYVPTVDIAFMLDSVTGYIKINQFGSQTYNEFALSMLKLKAKNAQQFIFDFRDNQGGLMDVCVAMVNEFLPQNSLIVYTEGRKAPRMDRKANGKGKFQDIPVAVLINSFSASASEIFAGAIQDHDRGVIVGRRSFGKGLVQEQVEMPDESALRLTIAEYFTPSGRNIQKPFKKGDKESYNNDINERYEHGEFAVADSTHFVDSLKYKTMKGRTVYGGGGIMPDVFVPLDTTAFTKYYDAVQRKSLVRNFAFHFADKHREKLSVLEDYKKMEKYITAQNYMQQFIAYATQHGAAYNAAEYATSKKVLSNQVMALIVRNIIDNEGFFPIYLENDPFIDAALKSLYKKEKIAA